MCDLGLQIGLCLHERILRVHPLEILIMPLPMVESKPAAGEVGTGRASPFREIQELHLFWSKRGDNFLKARVAAQGVPNRVKAQLPITQKARKMYCFIQLFERTIFLARPRINEG